jgi:hypothetical protein
VRPRSDGDGDGETGPLPGTAGWGRTVSGETPIRVGGVVRLVVGVVTGAGGVVVVVVVVSGGGGVVVVVSGTGAVVVVS